MAANGENTSTNASRLKVSFGTMQRIVKHGKEVGNIDVKKKSGQIPYVIIPKNPNITKKRSFRNDTVSLNSVAKGIDISYQSIQNIVKNSLGLYSYCL